MRVQLHSERHHDEALHEKRAGQRGGGKEVVGILRQRMVNDVVAHGQHMCEFGWPKQTPSSREQCMRTSWGAAVPEVYLASVEISGNGGHAFFARVIRQQTRSGDDPGGVVTAGERNTMLLYLSGGTTRALPRCSSQ